MILSKLHWETQRDMVPLFFKDVFIQKRKKERVRGGTKGENL